MEYLFDHERLEVYQEAIAFVAWWSERSSACCKGAPSIKDQMDRASTSMPLNIAEGNGKYSPRDRNRFLQVAYASTLECAAGLDVLVARRQMAREKARDGKVRLRRIVAMLIGLMNRNAGRIAEAQTPTRWRAWTWTCPTDW